MDNGLFSTTRNENGCMRKFITPSVIAIFILMSSLSMTAVADRMEDRLADLIRVKIAALPDGPADLCQAGVVCKSARLMKFYEDRDFRPAWLPSHARLPQMESLLTVIRDADREGLNPRDYQRDSLEEGIDYWRSLHDVQDADVDRLADLDLRLTDAFFRLGLHLYAGRLDYGALTPEWGAERKEADLGFILENALEHGDIGAVLKSFVPRHQAYGALKESLARHRAVAAAGGWPIIPKGTTFKKGQRGVPVIMLHERLALSGDLTSTDGDVPYIFDHSMEEAVKRFQLRHGLKVDGVISPDTLKFLNMPVEGVIRRIELNMDRMRWLPDDLGERHILVNIADYTLAFIDGDDPILRMRIVVGDDKKRSFIFSDRISYLELNPYWNIPGSIAEKEMLPKIKKDPEFFNKKHIKVIKGWSNPPVFIPPDQIDWPAMNPKQFRYRLRQEPGAGNPLGRIKFMFPNKFDVYLHDTSEKHLFKRQKRGLSHGCIRIEKPFELAVQLFPPDQGWTPETFKKEIRKGKTLNIRLPEAMPVYLVYWTAWVDHEGALQFRDDFYSLDTLWDLTAGR
jgi:murein L,D-transpeptidase YcbB/YkuD